MDEILWCYHSNETLQQYFHMVLYIQYVVLTFGSVSEILCCHHFVKSLCQYSHKVLSVFVSMLKNEIYKF